MPAKPEAPKLPGIHWILLFQQSTGSRRPSSLDGAAASLVAARREELLRLEVKVNDAQL